MGWFRSDRELAATKYQGRESASARRDRKNAHRQELAAEKRRRDHHRHAAAADRQGWTWWDRHR